MLSLIKRKFYFDENKYTNENNDNTQNNSNKFLSI
jgi:hypothetical protein